MKKARCLVFVFIILFLSSCGKNLLDSSLLAQPYDQDIDFIGSPFIYHFAPNSFIMDGDNKKAIASESLDDIELAARLGFSFIEANIWKTSDGHFVCTHGSNGTFGPGVKSIDSKVVTTEELRKTEIGSVTLDWIKTYVRYDSDYQEYQTTIPSLEEFCMACKQNGIGILAGVARNRKAVEICTKYLADSVVVYSPPDDIRDYFKGYTFTWNNTTGTTIESLLMRGDYYGPPYICSLGARVLSELEDRNELGILVEKMHKKNFLVGWASVYAREIDSMRYLRSGLDFSASGHEVNQFESNYELYDLDNVDRLPSTTGVISEGILNLSARDSVICGESKVISVGKGALSIKFKGTIRISFGSLGDGGDRYELESEGNELFVFTDYFFHRATTLTIISLSDNTTINHLVYTTSIC